ncbi:MAG: bifunctional 5,10-methylenetetrahydrofolate dehydrogenase/5,10-methenyltetrahydrofolate cyclohydrolase [Proteobacteria bacterium]|nr:bifunctional 5,10-methylenetetrahydrofolate dehydrogenase/5,10-methenyltetrahydrofolate cyclohydrolase [Pseudomonadota bacterium]
MTQIFNGKKTALHFLQKLQPHINELSTLYSTNPSLSIIRVGENPSSALYVKNKLKIFKSLGLIAVEHWFDDKISFSDLCSKIQTLNKDSSVHGIIIQLPLPSHLNAQEICNEITPLKDVDGLTLQNQGLLFQNNLSGLFPCTPLGCTFILKALLPNLSGKQTVILGRSLLVGKPLALLLLHENATVTMGHSKSQSLSELIKNSDILISAIGQPAFVKGSWLKKGAVVLDVGITKSRHHEKETFLGDLDFEEARQNASFITPVPGGIGPMTIACLVYNTYKAAKRILTGKPVPYDLSILENDLFFF